VTEGSGATTAQYTTVAVKSDAKYKVVLSNGSCSVTSNEVAVAITEEGCCNKPGEALLFTAFKPCPDAPVGSTWTLKDDRETDNIQSYKVKKMADGRIWMVQNLKFGKNCNKIKMTGSKNDQKDKVAPGYYGDCCSNSYANGGYFYDWAAAINKSQAYYNANANVGCSGTGTAASGCQGICPNGWHVPTKEEFDRADAKFNEIYKCGINCWTPTSQWESVYGGYVSTSGSVSQQGTSAAYWTSTHNNSGSALTFSIKANKIGYGQSLKNTGGSVRCIKDE
jgi:uncharacterized protein (TIGR02145 family)